MLDVPDDANSENMDVIVNMIQYSTVSIGIDFLYTLCTGRMED